VLALALLGRLLGRVWNESYGSVDIMDSFCLIVLCVCLLIKADSWLPRNFYDVHVCWACWLRSVVEDKLCCRVWCDFTRNCEFLWAAQSWIHILRLYLHL
jgi:hypothetical protein